jgi:hypothetical protein
MKDLKYSVVFNFNVNAVELDEINAVMDDCEEIAELKRMVNEIIDPLPITYSST